MTFGPDSLCDRWTTRLNPRRLLSLTETLDRDNIRQIANFGNLALAGTGHRRISGSTLLPCIETGFKHMTRIARCLIPISLFTLLLGLTALPGLATAKDYRIEVVMFENVRANPIPGNQLLFIPRRGAAMGLTTNQAQAEGFMLVEDEMILEAEASQIRNSSRYRLLKHFAWRQPGLDNREAKAIRVNVGRTIDVYIPQDYTNYDAFIPATQAPTFDGNSRALKTTTVNGILKVRLGRFLHLDSRLVFTDAERGTSYRLEHSRKMRSRELHYIDNPKFGLLVKILPIEGT